MSTPSSKGWVDDLKDVCVQFQLDLSCLVDGELEEVAGGRAIAHLEGCPVCREFFDDVRMQVRAHKSLADTDGLVAQLSALVGAGVDDEIERVELVHRLSTIFYQLGKAYVLNHVDPDFRTRVFEKAVQVGRTQREGRGFVDGVIARGDGRVGGLDWRSARHLLNGKLEKIEEPLEKGRKLLEEALAVDPTHEEARLYVAFLDARDGKRLRAAAAYRQIFRTAVSLDNRAHAVIQLGKLYSREGELKKALACSRWVVMSGLADTDDRFFFVRFNVGVYYAELQDGARALLAFRELLDRHPTRIADIVELFLRSERTRTLIDLHPGLAEALLRTCPELFAVEDDSDSEPGSEEESQ